MFLEVLGVGYGWCGSEKEVFERERESGLGLEAAEMKFLQKNGLLYAKSRWSEGIFSTASRAHEVAEHDFLLQQRSFCCNE